MALFWIIIGLSMLFFSRLKKQDIYIYIYTTLLVFLLGMRSVEMEKNDTYAYFEWFGYDSDLVFVQFEPLYALLNKYVYTAGLPFEVITLLMAFITFMFLILAFRKDNLNVLLTLTLYFLLVYYFRSFNIMRQMTAASIILYAYSCLRHKEIKKYFIFTLFASLIHYTSIVTFIIFLIRKEDTSFNKGFVIITLIITFLLGAINFFQPIIYSSFGSIFPRYFNNEVTRIDTFSVSKLAMNVFYIYMYLNVDTRNLYMKSFFIGICLINIITFHVDMMRISYMFLISEIMVLADCIDNNWKSNNGRMVSLIAIAYSLFIFFYLVIGSDMSGVLEYDYSRSLHY